ncbi:hypothetical protein ACFQL1_03135 [Halomicroarcula sp. GCM10025709]|uniref:hypothetical protein n=1 Tax=Halomicroarcula sp. GCM10025709 TaxID=3252669 RepID=UPI003623F6B1
MAVELTVEGLWLGRADGTTRWYPHEHLEGSSSTSGSVNWCSPGPTGATGPTPRWAGWSGDRRPRPGVAAAAAPPPDEATLSTAATAFELLSERLCYGFEVRRHDRDADAGVASRLR